MIFTNPKPQHQYEQVVRIEQEHFYNNVNIRTLELEYCAGGSLRQWLASNHVPSPPVFVMKKIFRDVLRELRHLHRIPMVHRDIKPKNILIDTDRDNRGVLSDFDIARYSTGATVTTLGAA